MADTRLRTNAEIDALNMFLKPGETPIPYEIKDANNSIQGNNATDIPPVELTEEQKAQIKLEEERRIEEDKAAALKQKELDAEAEKEKKRIISEQENKNTETTPSAEAELDDEKVLAYFKNKKGKEIASLEELLNPKIELTEADKKIAQEKRDADKIAFGLSKGIFTKKQLEEFITDTTNPEQLVFNTYSAQQKSKDPELTDAEIKEEFEEKFSLAEDTNSRKYEVGQNLLNNLADNIIRNKHSKILNLENDFSAFENSQSTQKEIDKKILSQAPLYKRDIEQVRSEIKKVSIPISETETFETEVDDEVVNDIISGMLDNNYSAHQIQNGWNKDTIKQVAQASVVMKSLPKLLKKYAEAEVLKQQAGVRGIVPVTERGRRSQEGELTERQKAALGFIDTALGIQTQVAN